MHLHTGWMCFYEDDCGPPVQALAEKARELDPGNADAHVVLGYVMVFNGRADHAGARDHFRLALQINPSHADAWLFSADLGVLEGSSGQAVLDVEQAYRLNPHPPPYYHWLRSWILYAAGRYDEIVAMSVRDRPQAIGFQRNLAAALAMLGREREAQDVARDFLRRVPQFTVASWITSLPFQDEALAQPFLEGYGRAGFPMR